MHDRQAMLWASENTADDSRFLVLTGTNSITCDLTLEWFPALSGRKSIYTVQGTEWTKGPEFASYVRSTYAVQECLTNGDLSCLDATVPRSDYDYIYLSKFLTWDCRTLEHKNALQSFLENVRLDPEFRTVYESERVLIFSK